MLVDYLRVFITGGVICALVQLLMEKTKMMPGRIMVLLVCSGAILGMLGIYKPILGFGYNLWKGVKEAVDNQGFFGLFTGGFTASAVGISGSLVFAFLASLVCNSKIKK